MSSPGRTLILLAIPAAAIGALGGLVLRAVDDTAHVPVATAPVAEPAPPRVRQRAEGRAPRAHRRVAGNDREGVTRLDGSFAARLSDPDEATRLRAALDLLRMGPAQLDAVELLEPATEQGRELRDRIAAALAALAQIEKGEDFPRLPEEARLDVRIKYWSQVVPESMLRSERKALWSSRVAGDAERVARGTISEGEAAWHQLELGLARRELGELSDAEWKAWRAERIGKARAWFSEFSARRDVGRDVVIRVDEALARFER